MPESSNTAQEQQSKAPGKPFTKGDPRINRNGRPKSFDALRALAQEIAHEKARAGGKAVVIEGHSVTVTEAILRQWAQSKDARLQQAFIKIAFGEDATRNLNLNLTPDDLTKLTDAELDAVIDKLTHTSSR